MGAGDATLVFELRQISSSSRLGHIELPADLENGNIADLGEEFGNSLAAGFNDVSGYFHGNAWTGMEG